MGGGSIVVVVVVVVCHLINDRPIECCDLVDRKKEHGIAYQPHHCTSRMCRSQTADNCSNGETKQDT